MPGRQNYRRESSGRDYATVHFSHSSLGTLRCKRGTIVQVPQTAVISLPLLELGRREVLSYRK